MFETCEKHLSEGQVLPYECANFVTQSRRAASARADVIATAHAAAGATACAAAPARATAPHPTRNHVTFAPVCRYPCTLASPIHAPAWAPPTARRDQASPAARPI
jgi:hypothetical protein